MWFRRTVPAIVVLGGLVAGVSVGAAGIPKDTGAVEHALNRLAYGPRPGDVERVQQIGLAKWIDQQLHPDAIDDSALTGVFPNNLPAPRT